MPKSSINYSKTIIYKIVCEDIPEYVYVGHTTNFTQRKKEHKSNVALNKPSKIYQIINENKGWDNWKMIEIEKYPCNDSNEARAREQHFIDEYKSNLNSHNASITKEDAKIQKSEYNKIYRETQGEELLKKKREYYEQNKESITEKRKEKMTCDCGSSFSVNYKARHYKSIKHLEYLKDN